MIISSQQLIEPWRVSNKNLPRNFVLSDKDYFCPTLDMVRDELFPKYWQWLKSLKLTRWVHRWDCDNFADAFKLFSCGYYEQTIESTANGIAIGVINYMAIAKAENNLSGGHAINIVYIDDGKNDDGSDNFRPIFIEPQNGKIYNLTEQEFNSIWTVYI
jgi:hypothetical protein